jgi:hypothetical protein
LGLVISGETSPSYAFGTLKASGGFEDTLNVVTGPASGYFDFIYSFTGSYDWQLPSSGSLRAVITIVPNQDVTNEAVAVPVDVEHDAISDTLFSGSSGITLQGQHLVIPYSGPTDVRFEATLSAGCNADFVNPCSADLLFGNTFAFTGFQVLDSQGNVAPNAVVMSDAGINWTSLPSFSEVPEPATAGLLLTGLILVVSRSRRFHSST